MLYCMGWALLPDHVHTLLPSKDCLVPVLEHCPEKPGHTLDHADALHFSKDPSCAILPVCSLQGSQ